MKGNQKGQALIELIIFLPLMFMVYSLVTGFANAINGSINQQKIARSYFYFRISNNSTTPAPDYPDQVYQRWQKFGHFFIGWRDKFPNEQPTMSCYRINIPIAANSEDGCDKSYNEPSSIFIRVGTVYGICGGTYINQGGTVVWAPHALGIKYDQLVDAGSCLIF